MGAVYLVIGHDDNPKFTTERRTFSTISRSNKQAVGKTRTASKRSVSQRISPMLVRRILRGEKEEFSVIVTEYQERIYRLLRRHIVDSAVAEDLTQQTFLKAYQGLKHFQFRSEFGTWLTRIALNEMHSYFESRAHRERQRNTEISSDHDSRDGRGDPSQHVGALQQALGVLKPELREVIVLCGIEGYPYEEVAKILDIPVGTVRSRLNSARLALRDVLCLKEGENER